MAEQRVTAFRRSGLALLLLTLCVAQLGFSPSLFAAQSTSKNQQQTQKQINKLQSDIRTLEKKLRSAQGAQKKQTEALRKAEKEGGKLSRQVRDNQQQIKKQQQQIGKLSGQRSKLQQQRDLQLAALNDEVAAAYRTGRQDRLRLLLNQQHPEQLSRMLRYHQYLSDARSDAVADIEQTLSKLDRVELQLTQQQQQLQSQRTQLNQRSAALQKSRKQRLQALASLKKEVSSQSKSLKRLKVDQQQLRQVLKELQQALELNELKVTTQSFAKLKGKLGWPTTSKRILQSYGSQNSQGVRRDGMLIRAAVGDSVKAVHNGRVLFSDWMRGYGLLLILDHGDGYMSLYGHNQSLSKQVGDWVGAGELIANAGDSGGQSQTGLYFAIRHNRESTNPRSWLKKR
ncbi:MAG: peptidoglycan DD-metalloendopeptidase family protein [Motiliproteus sp.]